MIDERVNPAAMSRPATGFQEFEFKDPNQPGKVLKMRLRPLTPGAYLRAVSFAQELNRLYIIGGGYFRGEVQKEPIPFPPLADGSQPELNYELLEQCCVLEFGQGCRRNPTESLPPPFYTAEMLVAANETMPIAMNQAVFVAQNFVANPGAFAPKEQEKKDDDPEQKSSDTTSPMPPSQPGEDTSSKPSMTADVSTSSAPSPERSHTFTPLT